MHLVLRCLIALKIEPEILSQGNKLMSLTVREYGVVFLDSIRYIPAGVDQLARQFDLSVSKGWFPHKKSAPEEFGRWRPCQPGLEYYRGEKDTLKMLRAKQEWIREEQKRQLESGSGWCINDELVK